MLNKNEKVFLKFFSIVKFLVDSNYQINLSTLELDIIKKLKIVKTAVKIKKLTSQEFYTNNFGFNVFSGNLKNVVISKSGYIKVYENNNYKLLNLLVAGHNIFTGSRVNNFPNKTIIFNKHFTVKIFVQGNKLCFKCSEVIDNFSSKSFYITIAKTNVLTMSNPGLSATNLLLLNSCKQTKFARKANFGGKNGILTFGCEVFNSKTMQNYINLTIACKQLNFLEKPIVVKPIYLNNFIDKHTSAQNLIMLRNMSGANKVIASSTFFMRFINSAFYASSLLGSAVFKVPLMLGEHKIVFVQSGIKIINLTENHTFYISTLCKIKSAQILNCELICEFVGDVKFCIANTPTAWQEIMPHNQSTLLKLERLFLGNIVKTLFAVNNSFYELTKIDETFYSKLKEIIKNKRSLRYASQIIIKLSSTAKNEAELKKLFKLSGLISSLPERKINLTELANRQNISLAELEQLTTEEQLELYKIKQQNPLDKNAKVC